MIQADTVGMNKLGAIFDTKGVPLQVNHFIRNKECCLISYNVQCMGSVNDIANSGVFLFSEGAKYITGVVLVVDGK